MSFTSHRRSVARSSSSWHGTATILEALVLLVFLLAAIALMTKTLALSYAKADEGMRLSQATMAAANAAEAFAANPTEAGITIEIDDDFTIARAVSPDSTESGTLYNATIYVFDADVSSSEAQAAASAPDAETNATEPLYTLSTCAYVSEVA